MLFIPLFCLLTMRHEWCSYLWHGARWGQIAICFTLYTLHAIIRPAGVTIITLRSSLFLLGPPHGPTAHGALLSNIYIIITQQPGPVVSFWFSLSDLRSLKGSLGVGTAWNYHSDDVSWNRILNEPFLSWSQFKFPPTIRTYLEFDWKTNTEAEELVENRGEKIPRIFPLAQIFAGYLPLSLWRNSTNTNLILQTFIWYFLINARI